MCYIKSIDKKNVYYIKLTMLMYIVCSSIVDFLFFGGDMKKH